MSSCILTLQDHKTLLCQPSHPEAFIQIVYAKEVEALSWPMGNKTFHSCWKSVQPYFTIPVATQYGISLSVTAEWVALGIVIVNVIVDLICIMNDLFPHSPTHTVSSYITNIDLSLQREVNVR